MPVASYSAPPAVATYSAPPMAAYSAPSMSYTSAPMVASYSPPPVAGYSQVASYSPPPMVVAPPAQAPQSRLTGIPDPRSIEGQKALYIKSIDDQLKAADGALQTERQQQRDYYLATIEQEKKQFNFQKDQEAAQKLAALDNHYALQAFQLQDAARQHRVELESQSARLIEDYNQRKAQTDLQNEQYALQKKSYDEQVKLQQQISHLMQHQQQLRA